MPRNSVARLRAIARDNVEPSLAGLSSPCMHVNRCGGGAPGRELWLARMHGCRRGSFDSRLHSRLPRPLHSARRSLPIPPAAACVTFDSWFPSCAAVLCLE